MRKARVTGFCVMGVLAVALLAQGACTSELGDEVFGGGEAYDMTTSALELGEIHYLHGYYGTGCENRDENARWSVALAGVDNILPAERLSVARDNTGCQLWFDRVELADELYEADVDIDLPNAIDGDKATGFRLDGAGEVIFFANAALDHPGDVFAGDFTVAVYFSDDVASATDEVPATLQVVEGSASEEKVESPNYTLDANLVVAVNARDEIVTVTGTLDLYLAESGEVEGQQYVVWDHEGAFALDTIGEIDLLWADLSDEGVGEDLTALALNGGGEDPQWRAIPYDDALFKLLNVDVGGDGVERTLLVRNLDEDTQIPAYQYFTITFTTYP